MNWEPFSENFDDGNGGALYCTDDDGEYKVAGALWLDGGDDGRHYFACVASFDHGCDLDGIPVHDRYSAAEAFSGITDGDVDVAIGMFTTMDAAVKAVDAFVATAETGNAHVFAALMIELEAGTWTEDLVERVLNDFGNDFNLAVTGEEYFTKDARDIAFYAETDFSDDESSADTLAYCFQEDLLDAHYPVAQIEVIEGWPSLN